MRKVYPLGGTILIVYSLIFVVQLDVNNPSTSDQDLENVLPGWHHVEEDWNINVGPYSFSKTDLLHSTNFSKISIAIGIPIAGSASYSSFLDSPLWNHFIPYFIKFTDIPNNKYSHTIILGYDQGDRLFDVAGVPGELQKTFYKTVLECLINKNQTSIEPHHLPVLKLVRVQGTHSPTQAVVAVMNQAYHEGFEYFYQMNDDTLFLTHKWEDILISNLKKSLLFPNFGVTGPLDYNNWDVVTHAFVHRTHLDIFGNFFPKVFKNWFSDDWITEVYGRRYCPRFGDVKVGHVASITRYEPDMAAQDILQTEITEGRDKLMSWITKYKTPQMARVWNMTKHIPPQVPNHVALKGV